MIFQTVATHSQSESVCFLFLRSYVAYETSIDDVCFDGDIVVFDKYYSVCAFNLCLARFLFVYTLGQFAQLIG